MEPIILNNLLPLETNLRIINQLSNSPWYIAFDKENDRTQKIFSPKNNGFSHQTILEGKIEIDSVLNVYGLLIFDIVKDKLNIKAEINRLYWNMYLKGSDSEIHKDRTESYFNSIVYNFHTTDGGTEIDGKFYPDVMGQAKIFKSNIPHKGIGPSKDNVRFNLNIIYKEIE
jgi:hypothetical protein